MSHSSLLHAGSGASSPEALFGIARELSLRADLEAAVQPCVSILRGAMEASACLVAFSPTPGADLRILFSDIAEARPGSTLRMGRGPGGMALERGESVVIRSRPGEARSLDFETPVHEGESVRGVILCRLPDPGTGGGGGSGGGRRTQDLTALMESVARLFEEALLLRRSLGYQGFGPLPVHADVCADEPLPSPARNRRAPEAASAGESLPKARERADESSGFAGMIGRSAPMTSMFALVSKVSETDATVLVTGESGTGKELVARAIHDLGKRASGPFIAVNCAALPESVIESELFGHEKGSFTGAHATRQGRFELAQDGTLFLDEIGELPPAIQVKLLRILQERSFERVGGTKTIQTNARIIAATNRDLALEVRERRFREDLYFRLDVFPIHVPPLRERGADILLLADHFAGLSSVRTGREVVRISSPSLDLFMSYHWPGNVRELENCIERAAILSSDGVIHSYNLPPSLQSAESTGTAPLATLDGAIARLEKEMLIEALKMDHGNSASAALRLGVTERRFRLGLDRYKIDWRRFRTKK